MMSSPSTTSGFKVEASTSGSNTQRRAQIGEQLHLLAQAQQAALGLQREGQIVPFRAADRAEQHGVGGPAPCFIVASVKGVPCASIGGAADQILVDLEAGDALAVEPVDDARDLAHHLRADAVAGQEQKFLVRRHDRLIRSRGSGQSQGCAQPALLPRRRRSSSSFCKVRPISSSPFSRQCLRNGSMSKCDGRAVGPGDRLRFEIDR